jgi:secretion/DNA translocation related TadE-like protein
VRKICGSVKNDHGAGTILAISILIVFFALFSASSLVSTQLLAFTRFQATTNSIALAAADALRGVSTGNPCIVAKDIASNNQLVIKRCRIVGFEVFIETSVETFGIVHQARARAGPGE